MASGGLLYLSSNNFKRLKDVFIHVYTLKFHHHKHFCLRTFARRSYPKLTGDPTLNSNILKTDTSQADNETPSTDSRVGS